MLHFANNPLNIIGEISIILVHFANNNLTILDIIIPLCHKKGVMVIGRKAEIQKLDNIMISQSSELLMVTGRRRIGKTFLINEVLKDHIVFKFTGTQYGSTANQLEKFVQKLAEYDANFQFFSPPKTWLDAFSYLKRYLNSLRKSNRKRVIFFDEFPWIDQPKSGFTSEFGYWWNDFATSKNILVVISGSSTAWMIRKVIQDRGGLHNRVTHRIHLEPFSLSETKLFLHQINKSLTDYDILQIYMCTGGVPLYLSQLGQGESVAQFVHRVFFSKSGLLNTEFNELYASLFDHHERHVAVIRSLATKWSGMTVGEISKSSKLSNGGGLNRILQDLEQGSFIVPMHPLFNKKKDTVYRLVDEYSRFYIHFVDGHRYGNINDWTAYHTSSDAYKAWQGYAFETICIKHIEAIKSGLGIAGVYTEIGSFLHKGTDEIPGLQIDILIDRADNVINICEVKFYNKPIQQTSALADKIRNRAALFGELSKTRKAIFNTLISTFGTDSSTYHSSDIHNSLDMSCLFEQKNL